MFLSYTKFPAKPIVWAWNPSSMRSWGRRTVNARPAWTSKSVRPWVKANGGEKISLGAELRGRMLPRIQKTLASIPNAAKLVNKRICTNLRKGYSRIRMLCGDQLSKLNHTIKRVSMLYWLAFLSTRHKLGSSGKQATRRGIFLISVWCGMPSLLGAASSLDRWSWGV